MARYKYTRSRRSRRKVFGPKAVRAIKSIARTIPETKYWVEYVQPNRYIFSTNNNYLSDRAGRYLINLYGNIPRFKNTGVVASTAVIGYEFDSVGVSLRFAATVTGSNNYRVRITVFSSAGYYNQGLGPDAIGATNNDILDVWQPFTEPTIQAFNSNNVNVLGTKTISINTDGGVVRKLNMWVPIKGTKRSTVEESTLMNTYVGRLTGRNYYAAVEWFTTATTAATVTDHLKLAGQIKVYFKDP